MSHRFVARAVAVVERQVCRQVENQTRLGCVGCRLLRCVAMPVEGEILELGTQADTDRLQDRSTGGRGGRSVHGVHSGRNVYRPFSPGPVVRRELVGGPGEGAGIKRASDPVPHCAHGEGAAGNRSLDVPGFSAPFAQSRTPFHRSISMLPETNAASRSAKQVRASRATPTVGTRG